MFRVSCSGSALPPSFPPLGIVGESVDCRCVEVRNAIFQTAIKIAI